MNEHGSKESERVKVEDEIIGHQVMSSLRKLLGVFRVLTFGETLGHGFYKPTHGRSGLVCWTCHYEGHGTVYCAIN